MKSCEYSDLELSKELSVIFFENLERINMRTPNIKGDDLINFLNLFFKLNLVLFL